MPKYYIWSGESKNILSRRNIKEAFLDFVLINMGNVDEYLYASEKGFGMEHLDLFISNSEPYIEFHKLGE